MQENGLLDVVDIPTNEISNEDNDKIGIDAKNSNINGKVNASNEHLNKRKRKHNKRQWNEEKIKKAYRLLTKNTKKSLRELEKELDVNPQSIAKFRKNMANGQEFIVRKKGPKSILNNLEFQQSLIEIISSENSLNHHQIHDLLSPKFKFSHKIIPKCLASLGYVDKKFSGNYVNINTPDIIEKRFQYAYRVKDIQMDKLIFLDFREVTPKKIISHIWVRENEEARLKSKDCIRYTCLIDCNGIVAQDLKQYPYDSSFYELFISKFLSQTTDVFVVCDINSIHLDMSSKLLAKYINQIIILPPYSRQLNPAHTFLDKVLSKFDEYKSKDSIDAISNVMSATQSVDTSRMKDFYNYSNSILHDFALQKRDLLNHMRFIDQYNN